MAQLMATLHTIFDAQAHILNSQCIK